MREMLTKETPPSTFLMVQGETMLAQDKGNFHALGKNRTRHPLAQCMVGTSDKHVVFGGS